MEYKYHEETAMDASQKGLNDELDLAYQSEAKERAVVDDDTEDTEVGLVGVSHSLVMRL